MSYLVVHIVFLLEKRKKERTHHTIAIGGDSVVIYFECENYLLVIWLLFHLPCWISIVWWVFSFFFFPGEIQCEQLNNSLYTFTGNLIIGKQTLPLSPNQILLWVCLSFSLIKVYHGMLWANKNPIRLSNQFLLYILFFKLIVFCLLVITKSILRKKCWYGYEMN